MPYHARDEPCNSYKAAVTSDGYVKLKRNSAIDLETALATVGPVAITVSANWGSYGGGIFSGGCNSMTSCTLDHAVLAVGYTQDYWLIRNSWGEDWGKMDTSGSRGKMIKPSIVTMILAVVLIANLTQKKTIQWANRDACTTVVTPSA